LSAPGTVALAPKVDFVTTNGPHDIAVADIDGDGKPDVVTPNYGAFASGNTISVLRNTSTPGTIALAAAVNFTTAPGPTDLAVGGVFRNTSTPGAISFAAAAYVDVGAGPREVAIGDLDGDGRPEIVVSNYGGNGTSNVVSVLRNLSAPGTIAFAPKASYPVARG